jgi:hypothetical protein
VLCRRDNTWICNSDGMAHVEIFLRWLAKVAAAQQSRGF